MKWVIAQNIESYGIFGTNPPYEAYYVGGGEGLFSVPDAVAVVGQIYNGGTPKFLRNQYEAACFLRKAKAEEVAFLLSVEHPELIGRLYLVEATWEYEERRRLILSRRDSRSAYNLGRSTRTGSVPSSKGASSTTSRVTSSGVGTTG